MTCEDHGPKTASDHGSCSPALRNRYFRGKLLTVADYKAEQRYFIERRRMVNRAVLGWGVISGFSVKTVDERKVEIGPGVAFDKRGREAVACEKVRLNERDDVVWLKSGKVYDDEGGKRPASSGNYILSAHYAECRVDCVRMDEGCGEPSVEWNHIRETVVYSLQPRDDHSAHRRCHTSGFSPTVCNDPDAKQWNLDNEKKAIVAGPTDRGPHATLARWSADWLENSDLCTVHELCTWKGLSFDPSAGVPLAVVAFSDGGCGGFFISEIDEVAPRRLMRPNDALYDLIRGCDLTRIQDVGWGDWHGLQEHVRRGAFRRKFVTPPSTNSKPSIIDDDDSYQRGAGEDSNPPVDTLFWVCFSAPVQIASLTPDVMSIAIIRPDDDDRGVVRRIPIERLWIQEPLKGDPEGTTRSFRPMVSWKYWDGEIKPRASSGLERVNRVEIHIHCDSIIDWAGQAVDGNAIGQRFPSGNGTPGGDFASRFTVDPNGTYPPPHADGAAAAAPVTAA